MFLSLRNNLQFYILTKGINPRLDIGIVTNVSLPLLKFMTMPSGLPEYIVDVQVSVNGQMLSFLKLPANKEIADFGDSYGNIVVSTSREAMNNEIASLKNKSEDHIKRVDEEKQKIAAYEAILLQLNPEYAEKLRLDAEISNLKSLVEAMAQSNANLEQMLKLLLSEIKESKS